MLYKLPCGLFAMLLFLVPLALGDEPSSRSTSRFSSQELAEWIDQEFDAIWRPAKIVPPAVIDDATFLKRTFLDLNGTLPSVSRAREFLDQTSLAKRDELVDQLLNETRRPDKFAERTAAHWATLWRRMMVPGNTPEANVAVALEPWLKEQFSANRPYDEIARTLITATSGIPDNFPLNARSTTFPADPSILYRVIGGKPENAASSFTRIFLGTRIGCAECHDHPFAPWKQKDFWGTAAFFAGFKNGVGTELPFAKIQPANSSIEYSAAFLDGSDVPYAPGKAPRDLFADWMVSPKNKQFSATSVNRVWMCLLGRGLTDSVDDLDKAPPAERKSLDALAQRFVEAHYDLRWLIAGICKSKLYQRDCAKPGETDGEPPPGFRVVKTLTPEQVFNSLEQALVLPISKDDASARYNGLRSQLVARMNEAATSHPDEYRAGIPQTLLLMNGRITAEATDLDQSRTLRGVLDAPFLDEEAKLNTLYLAALSRLPRPEEVKFLMDHIRKRPEGRDRNLAYSEIFWSLLNSPEFVLQK